MAKDARKSIRIAHLSRPAEDDLYAIYAYTGQRWGENQADEYSKYLAVALQTLADSPGVAPLVTEKKNTRVYVVRWKNARQGHRIYFRETREGIFVLRILHTSRDKTKGLK